MIMSRKLEKHRFDDGDYPDWGRWGWLPDYELDNERPLFTDKDYFLMVSRWDKVAENDLQLKKYSKSKILYGVHFEGLRITYYLTKLFYFWYMYPYADNWKNVVYLKLSSIPRLKNGKKVRRWDIYKTLWAEQSDSYASMHNSVVEDAKASGLETKRPFGIDEFATHGFCATYCDWLSGKLFENDYVTKEQVFEKIDELLAKSLHVKKLEDFKIG